MFQGYLSFAGTEIANVARTKAYVDHLMPTYGLIDGYDSESLPCILGDGRYNNPALDSAPWYSASRRESAGFYGFYPLSIVGIEDSSESANVTELVGPGAVVSLPRTSSREFRVQGILIGDSKAATSYGLTWLRGALAGGDCRDDDCTGDSLCYLAWLPECCDYSDTDAFPAVPLSESTASTSVGSWTVYGGASAVGTADGMLVTMPCAGDGVQNRMSGLIPGQHYRLTMEVASGFALTVGIAGVESITAHRQNSHFPDGKTPWVVDFVALESEATVRVVAPGQGCEESTARIYGIQVERTAGRLVRSLPRFTSTNTREPGSWAFDSVPADFDTSAALDPAGLGIESLALRWKNTSVTSEDLPAGSGASRIIRGLTPGRDYRVVVNAVFSDSQEPAFTVPGSTATTTSLGNDWYAVSFTATAPQHQVHIGVGSITAVAAGDTLSLTLYYLRADLDASLMELPEPDQSRSALRTLYQVSRINGPIVLSEVYKAEGSMVQVEFTMVAAHPFRYSATREIENSPSSTVAIVPEVVCSLGYPVRTNYFTSPRFDAYTPEGPVQGGIGVNASLVFDPDEIDAVASLIPGPVFDSSSLQLIAEGSDEELTYVEVPTSGVLTAGHTYTFSARVGIASPQANPQSAYARSIVISDGGGIWTSNAHPNVEGWSYISVTFTYTPGLEYIRLYHGGVAGDSDVFWTDLLFEESPTSGSFFDGDSTDAEWTGTPGESTSVWTKQGAPLIVDPDCPPIPSPPSAPTIEQACPPDIDTWRRYPTYIPAGDAGGWAESVPVVSLTTIESEVRHVRIRFYADPFSRGIEAANPCDYCGEFFIAYIPPNTTMTIDGILRQASADVAGTGSQTVMNLLSASDGGPVQWPSLACDVPYIMTVDVAPAEVLDLDVSLSIAQKE